MPPAPLTRLRLSPTVVQEMDGRLEDAEARASRHESEEADSVYRKINAASERDAKGFVLVDATADEVAELKDRAEYVVECFEEREDFGCVVAYRALLRQLAKATGTEGRN